MPIGLRNKVLAGIVLVGCAIVAGRHAADRTPADPCKADPGAYACAMFAQPEWLKRRVYAGRMETRPTPPPPAVDVEAVAASAEVAEPLIGGI